MRGTNDEKLLGMRSPSRAGVAAPRPVPHGVSAVILSPDLPGGNVFFARVALAGPHVLGATRCVRAWIRDGPRLSAAAVGAAVPTDPRHRGNGLRFLRHLPGPVGDDFLAARFADPLAEAPAPGTWVF